MTDSTSDRIEGKIDQATGQAKEAVGDVTGNEQLQAEGKMEQAQGGLEETFADLKDKVSDFFDGDDSKPDKA